MTTAAVSWLLFINDAPMWVWIGYLVSQCCWITLKVMKEIESK